jgi:HK97 family phage portal protein
MVLRPAWQRHFWAPYDEFEDVVEYGYKKNATVFACMTVLSWAFPEPELWPWERGDRNEYRILQGHPLRALMRQPNLDMGEVELFQFAITYAPLGGNAYFWKQRDQAERVKALWPLHDGQITPVPGMTTSEGFTAYYVLDVPGDNEQYNPFGLDRHDDMPGVAIPKSEMIHWKWMIDPSHPHRGMGALEASAGDVAVGNEIRDYIYSFLKNDATPPIVVTLVEGDELTEGKAERLREQWIQSGGGDKRGMPRFLEAGMGVEQLMFSLREMEFGELRDGPDSSICMGFHIHPSVVGTLAGLSSSTFSSDYSEANKALAEQTLIPLWRSLASEFEQSLTGEIGYGDDLVVRFDLSQVRALQESEKDIEERLGSAFDRGGITRAEYRRGMGYDADEADEVYKENLASIWVPRGKLREYDPELLGAEEERQGGEEGSEEPEEPKTLPQSHKGHKEIFDGHKGAMLLAEGVGVSLRRARRRLESRMAEEVEAYFGRLANSVVSRVRKGNLPQRHKGHKVRADELITAGDGDVLEALVKRFYVAIAEASWDTINLSLGVEVAFDAANPAVTKVLGVAGDRVKDILDTAKDALRDTLQYGQENGWDVDMLVAGDPEAGVPGIRDVVAETYKNRHRTIARTELGLAQNAVAVNRYDEAGVQQVLVLDDGFDNSDENCVWISGKVRPLAWTKSDHPGEGPSGIKNPLQHPNCVRAFAPYFGD